MRGDCNSFYWSGLGLCQVGQTPFLDPVSGASYSPMISIDNSNLIASYPNTVEFQMFQNHVGEENLQDMTAITAYNRAREYGTSYYTRYPERYRDIVRNGRAAMDRQFDNYLRFNGIERDKDTIGTIFPNGPSNGGQSSTFYAADRPYFSR